MFPISKDKLSIREITDYWSREMQPPASPNELLACFERAWWLGEILGDLRLPSRLELLKSLFKLMRNRDTPELLFVTSDTILPANTVERGDGSLDVDLRPRVLVPSNDPDTWTEASCNGAFQAMAEIPSLEHYAEYSFGFTARKLTVDEFFKWIARRGFDLPKFWKRPDDEATSLQLKLASERMIEDEVRRVYDTVDKEGKKPPNIKEVAKPALARLQEVGYTASARQIEKIAERPEFKRRRRPPGKTISSDKRGSRK
jgi:hypothetical protein